MKKVLITYLASIAFTTLAFVDYPFGVPVPYPATNSFQLPPPLTQHLAAPIIRKDIYQGVSLFKIKYRNLFGEGNNELCMFVIDWKETNGKVGLNLGKDRSLNRTRPTELMMANPNCIATINGFYHRTVDPSRAYFPEKIDGEIYEEITDEFPLGSVTKYFDGILLFNKFEPPTMGPFRHHGWIAFTNYQFVAGADGMPVSTNSLPDNPRMLFTDKSENAVAKRNRFRGASRVYMGQNTNDIITVIFTVDTKLDGLYRALCRNEGMWILKQFGIDSNNTICPDGGGSVTCATKLWVTALPTTYDNPDWPQKKYPIPVIENEPRHDHVNIRERRVITSLQIVVRD